MQSKSPFMKKLEEKLGLPASSKPSESKYQPDDGIDGSTGGNIQSEFPAGNSPLEPKRKRLSKPSILKWVVFLLFVIYFLISYYRAPILSRLGAYLVVEHPEKKVDLIVCLTGGTVERGITTAEAYKKGLAPLIFLGREELPDGHDVLKSRHVNYPETRDLLIMMLQGLGVPRASVITHESAIGSTFQEAKVVRNVVMERDFSSLMIITSPIHTRRAWLTYRKIFGEDDVEIIIMPSTHSKFKSDTWWKKEKYVQAVVFEYLKLAYYALKYF